MGNAPFQHIARTLIPCWSYFMQTNSTHCCGVVFNFASSTTVTRSKWLAPLLASYGCEVLYESAMSSLRKQFYPPKPKPFRNRWVHSPDHSAALRRQVLGHAAFPIAPIDFRSPMRVGLIQRSRSRRITNYAELSSNLTSTWPGVVVDEEYMESLPFHAQAAFFVEHDVIVAAHGAALTNAVFVRHGTIVVECFPPNYYPLEYYRGLVQQSGGIHVDWHVGNQPVEDFARHSHNKSERVRHRNKNFRVSPEQVIFLIKQALKGRAVLHANTSTTI